MEINEEHPVERPAVPEPGRRNFLLLLPPGILGLITLAFTAAAKRSLSPPPAPRLPETAGSAGAWTTLGPLSELQNDGPIAHTITVERQAGWARTVEEQTVYVLPQHDHKVLSSVCPHEGCPVIWDQETKNFLCPCHDSFFTDGGVRLSGPANSDLTQMPTRVEDGKLQIKVT